MSKNPNDTKTDFVRLVLSTIDYDSSDMEKAKEYLLTQGINAESIMSEGMKRIKKMKLKIEADKTRQEMNSADDLKQEARDWADKTLSEIDFSFPEFVKKEKMSLAFNNLQSLSKEDIKNILIQHFTLKLLHEKKKN